MMLSHDLIKKLKKLQNQHGTLPVEVANIDTLGDDEWAVGGIYFDAGTVSIHGGQPAKFVITA